MSTEKTNGIIAAQELLDHVKSHELDDETRSFILQKMSESFNETQILTKKVISNLDKIDKVRRDLNLQRLKLRRNINVSFSALIGAIIIVTSLIGPNRYFVFLPAVAVLLIGQTYILLRWYRKRRSLSDKFRELSELEAEMHSSRQEIDEISRTLHEAIDLIQRKQRGSE